MVPPINRWAICCRPFGTDCVSLVTQMLDLHKQVDQVKTAHDKTLIQRQIDATDRQIDRLVYELYDLTEEETCAVSITGQLKEKNLQNNQN